jgi:CheY-like chemotaxis protein
VTLPLVIKTTPAVTPWMPPPLVIKTDKKIILSIDDDPEVLTLLSDTLQGTGYACVGAQSGQEGLAMARQIRPHAITLDIMMPHMDGWTVLQKLKNDPELRIIPVYIVSVMENKALGFSLGVTDYIVKPFDRQSLLSKLKQGEESGKKRILVVDDDPSMTRLFEEALKQEGYAVEVAGDGRRALDSLARSKPDILFLDLMMPECSGFDVLEEIGKDPRLQGLRVFVMTAKHLTPQETQYLEKRVEMIVKKGSRSLHDILALLKDKLEVIKAAGAR